MGLLIDKDALLEQIWTEREQLALNGNLAAEHIVTHYIDRFVADAPEAIVRCKDCKYWVEEGNDIFGYAMFCDHDCSLGGQGIKKPDDYCNYGEKNEID